MTVAIERYGRRYSGAAFNSTFVDGYLAVNGGGAVSRAAAVSAVTSAAVAALGDSDYAGYYLDTIDGDEENGGTLWKFTATYKAITDATSLTFEAGGATQHITHGVHHISSDATQEGFAYFDQGSGGYGAEYVGLINPTIEGDVNGTDIVAPSFKFSVTLYVATADMTPEYIDILKNAQGKTNDDDISMLVQGVQMDFEEGELLLESITGGVKGIGQFELVFHFAESDNVADVCAEWDSRPWDPDASPSPAAVAVAKKGWEYLSVLYIPFTDTTAKREITRPGTVFVDKVYFDADFSLLGIPSPPP